MLIRTARGMLPRGVKSPAKKVPAKTEYQIQKECMKWLRDTYPGVVATATVGGAHLSSGPRGAAKLRAAGYLNGIPDVLIFRAVGNEHGLFIELKRPQGRVRPEQEAVITDLRREGYRCQIVRSEQEFRSEVESYLGPAAPPPPAGSSPSPDPAPADPSAE